MSTWWGVMAAASAVIGWGVGDFFIQKTARRLGTWKPLFFINLTAGIFLLPFVWPYLPLLINNHHYLALLFLLTGVEVFTVAFYFRALRQGKMAAVEPIIGLELPITVGLAVVVANESLNSLQSWLIVAVFVGVLLVMVRHLPQQHWSARILEKGVLAAGLGAIGMAVTNFLIGYSSQQIAPLVPVWFANTVEIFLVGGILLKQGELKKIPHDFYHHTKFIVTQCIFDVLGWVAYSYSTTILPIAIAVTITENYIVLAALLGIVINKERLRPHQYVGIIVTLGSVIILSIIS